MIREAHLWGSEVELHYPNGLSTPVEPSIHQEEVVNAD
jgi:hypothetical protein